MLRVTKLGHLNFPLKRNASSSFLNKNMLSFKLKCKEKAKLLSLLILHSLLNALLAFFFPFLWPCCCPVTSLPAGYLALQWLAGLIGARDRWRPSVSIGLVSGGAIAHTGWSSCFCSMNDGRRAWTFDTLIYGAPQQPARLHLLWVNVKVLRVTKPKHRSPWICLKNKMLLLLWTGSLHVI